MYGSPRLLQIKDEIFSWQSPIVWSIMPDEKDVKKICESYKPTSIRNIRLFHVYIDDPADSHQIKRNSKQCFERNYFEFINKVFKISVT